MRVDWTDAAIIVGAGLVAYGLWMVYHPLSWICLGGFLVLVGVRGG